MSFVTGGPLENADLLNENENAGARRIKRDVLVNKNGAVAATKRSALGTITNQLRVQPPRAAKPKGENGTGQDENAYSKQSSKSLVPDSSKPFSIFVDDAENIPPVRQCKQKESTSDLKLVSAITAVPRQPLTSAHEVIELSDDSLITDSPMDTSLNALDCDKKPLDRDAIIMTVPEYADDIYSYLKEAETKNRAKPGYIKKQPDITSSMRSILLDWLVEVAEEYKLHRETLFLAANYIDRFLSQMSVLRGKLQLVGAASMFLAGKYEEIYPPDVGEFVYITDDTYTKKQVLRMEHLILKVLNFDVAVPTANWFCDNFLNMIDADQQMRDLAMYLCELTLIDSEIYLKYVPSVIAASAVCLAHCTLEQEAWPSVLAEKSGYETSDFSECLEELFNTFTNAPNHQQQSIRDKYKSTKFNQVSLLTAPAALNLTS